MKLLLHICCANCAIYPVTLLRTRGVEISGYFFNHNIHPYREFQQRLDAVHQFAEEAELPVVMDERYALDEFLMNVASAPGERCGYCYRSRMEATARYAQQSGFEAFSTSLLYSRYQQHDLIRAIGEDLGGRFGLSFYYDDFRLGWQAGITASKAMGLYRQQYCGCIYSERDRYQPHRSER